MNSYRIFYKNGRIDSDTIDNINRLDFELSVNGINTVDEIHFNYYFENNNDKKYILILENLENTILNAKFFIINDNLLYEKVANMEIKEYGMNLLNKIIDQSNFFKKTTVYCDYN